MIYIGDIYKANPVAKLSHSPHSCVTQLTHESIPVTLLCYTCVRVLLLLPRSGTGCSDESKNTHLTLQ